MKTRWTLALLTPLALVACGPTPATAPGPAPPRAVVSAAPVRRPVAPEDPSCAPGTTSLPDGSCLPDSPPVDAKH